MSSGVHAARLVEHVRYGLGRLGLADSVRVHYGGQKRGRAHRLWLTGSVLGVTRELCMVIGADDAADERHLSRFVGQCLGEAAQMALANRFRP